MGKSHYKWPFSIVLPRTMEHEYITTCLKSFDIGYRTCPNTGFFVLLGAQTNGQPHQQPKRNPRPQGLTYHVASLQKKAYLPKILQFSIGKVRFQDFTPSKPSIFQGCMMFSGTKATFHVIPLGAQAQRKPWRWMRRPCRIDQCNVCNVYKIDVNMGMGQNPIPLVNIKNSWDLWMFIPLKMVCIGIDP